MVLTGLEVLVSGGASRLRGKRYGLVCHPASVDSRCRHIVDVLVEAGTPPAALFGPEHGVGGEAQDMIGVSDARHPRLAVPIHSLYGDSEASLAPSPEQLADLELVVIDLQDIGTRYYTYVWSMVLVMRACAEAGCDVMVLDRPNPLGGVRIEGPSIEPGYRSFVGLHPVPVRHGLTIGELARLTAAELNLQVKLDVVPMSSWERGMVFGDCQLPWVLPSPNMPTPETALVYPGACLVEGTQLSEGRGTTRPFEIIGAPWVEGVALERGLQDERLAGVRFRPLSFRPTFQKFGGKPCGGVQLHVTDRDAFRPLRVGVALLRQLSQLWPDRFAWRTEPYEFVSDRPAVDLLAGGTWLREGIEQELSLPTLCGHWEEEQRRFAARRTPHLMYS